MIVLAVLLALSAEPDCAQVKAMIAQHGKIAAYTWALAHGYTPREISRIRKACGI